jgi:hypothetical protein
MSGGVKEILLVRLMAITTNLLTLVAAEGGILTLPILMIGIWKKRQESIVKHSVTLWIILFLVMSIVFPFAGMRGGFLHSSFAFQPVLWACAAIGFRSLIERVSEWRNWKQERAWMLFAILLVGSWILISLFTIQKIQSTKSVDSATLYQRVEGELNQRGYKNDLPVMVNNPPGYFLASGRSAVMIPTGTKEDILTIARKYHTKIILIDDNHRMMYPEFFEPNSQIDGFTYLNSIESIQIFTVDDL